MNPTCSQSEPKWFQTGPKMIIQWFQNDPKVVNSDSKVSKNCKFHNLKKQESQQVHRVAMWLFWTLCLSPGLWTPINLPLPYCEVYIMSVRWSNSKNHLSDGSLFTVLVSCSGHDVSCVWLCCAQRLGRKHTRGNHEKHTDSQIKNSFMVHGSRRMATGPPRQATGPSRSGAGVGVGVLRGNA